MFHSFIHSFIHCLVLSCRLLLLQTKWDHCPSAQSLGLMTKPEKPNFKLPPYLKFDTTSNEKCKLLVPPSELIAPVINIFKKLGFWPSCNSTEKGSVYFEVFTSWPRVCLAANKTLPYLDSGSIAATPNITPFVF